MDRYTRVEKPKPESPINENEIRITSGGPPRNYISYGTSLLQEKHVKEIVLKAMGQAISKTVSVAEGIKRRNPRLHQDTAISSVSITDVWEPLEEGLVPVEQTRQVSMITITLSFKELNKMSSGGTNQRNVFSELRVHDLPLGYLGSMYQAPHSMEQPKQQKQQQQQPRQARGSYNAVPEDSYGRGDLYGRGRGRGRGRNWGRGGGGYGYGNYHGNYRGNYHGSYQGNYHGNYQGNYKDNGGYSNRGDRGGYSNRGDRGGYSNRGDRGGYSNRGDNGGYSNRGDNGGQGDDGGYSNQGRAGAGAGIGVIVTLDMKEEEVEGAEAMAMVVEGWPITQGVAAAAAGVLEVAVAMAMAMAAKLKKRMVFSPFASAKFLPRPVG
ncbi:RIBONUCLEASE P SUBUNIT P25 [Salix koriyanagi]|uniref:RIBONUCLEASE P SUBUNIT P25 n=1 Tax=Salix koriyanagi TaxID=2511006 RepID=A0A9Q0YUW0_9ROSI|nr:RIBONUCLEASE P SUBUNIT P25 [Salix koriyanagi]